MTDDTIDITPTPRVLAILGEIPFEPWRCFAELMDNSLDAFSSAKRRGIELKSPQVTITWSDEKVPPNDREVLVKDNGVGMPLATLQNAARAGFSSNDPVHNLGLFGMGFNIATAKLGEETLFLSTTRDAKEWVGIRINFDELQKSGSFKAPVVRAPKENAEESGTKIIVRKLKDGIYQELCRKSRQIKERLSRVYTPILSKLDVSICVQNQKLTARPLCVWGESRFVVRNNEKIFAKQIVDIDLGEMYFDEGRNKYVTEDEYLGFSEEQKKTIKKRPRHLTGWVGIQRFFDQSEFGIDFIRNGRKILIGDKSFFQFENEITGSLVSEYPIELGSTVGGRIVGELYVDYLIPTYQKNGFEVVDGSWELTRNAVRGIGPLLPKNRKAQGFSDKNSSPLGLLVNAYRRPDKGTKCMVIDNQKSLEFYKEFQKGNPEYFSDEKWYKVAQELDRIGNETNPPAPGNDDPSDPNPYPPPTSLPPPTPAKPSSIPIPPTKTEEDTSSRNFLRQHSQKKEMYSSVYSLEDNGGGLHVSAFEVIYKQIKKNGKRIPCLIFQDGIEIEFFYDPTHAIFSEYPISIRQVLLMLLAERFSIRDTGLSMMDAFTVLVTRYMEGERINAQALQMRATFVLQSIKEALPDLLCNHIQPVRELLKADSVEESEFVGSILNGNSELLDHYQKGDFETRMAFFYLPNSFVVRLVSAHPEWFLDGKLFDQPYSTLTFPTEDMTQRLRQRSVSIITTYLNDAVALLRPCVSNFSKLELIRYSKSLDLLEAKTK